jgi:hypothetical protein
MASALASPSASASAPTSPSAPTYKKELWRCFFTFKGFAEYRSAAHNRQEVNEMRRRACFSLHQAQYCRAERIVQTYRTGGFFLQVCVSDGFTMTCSRPGSSGNSAAEEFLDIIQRITLRKGIETCQFRLSTPPVHMSRDSKAETLYSILSSWLLWSPGVASRLWHSLHVQRALESFEFRVRFFLLDGCKTNKLLERDIVRGSNQLRERYSLVGIEIGNELHDAVVLLNCFQHILCVARNRALIAEDGAFWSSVVRFAHLYNNGRFRAKLLAVIFHLASERVKPLPTAVTGEQTADSADAVARFLRRHSSGLSLHQQLEILGVFNAGIRPGVAAFSLTDDARVSFKRRLWAVITHLFDMQIDVPLLFRWKNSLGWLDFLARGFYFVKLLPDALEMAASISEEKLQALQSALQVFDFNPMQEVERNLNMDHAAVNITRLGRTLGVWRQDGMIEHISSARFQCQPFDSIQNMLFQRSKDLTRLQVLDSSELKSVESAALKNKSSETFCHFVSGRAGLELIRGLLQPLTLERRQLPSVDPLLEGLAVNRFNQFCKSLQGKTVTLSCRVWFKMRFHFCKAPFTWFEGVHAVPLEDVNDQLLATRAQCGLCIDKIFSPACFGFLSGLEPRAACLRAHLFDVSCFGPLGSEKVECTHGDLRQYVSSNFRGRRRMVDTIEEEGYLLSNLRDYGVLATEIHQSQDAHLLPASVVTRIQNGFGRKKGMGKRSHEERKQARSVVIQSKRKKDGSWKRMRVTGWNIFHRCKTKDAQHRPEAWRSLTRASGFEWKLQVGQIEKDNLLVSLFTLVGFSCA